MMMMIRMLKLSTFPINSIEYNCRCKSFSLRHHKVCNGPDQSSNPERVGALSEQQRWILAAQLLKMKVNSRLIKVDGAMFTARNEEKQCLDFKAS